MIKLGRFSYNVTEDIDCYSGVNLTIGNFCSIGSGLKIYSGKHACIDHPEVVSTYPFAEQLQVDYPRGELNGQVDIGHDVWVATDVRILEGITIGSGSIIAAGTLVTKDVPPYSFVAGNPGEVKYRRFSNDIIKKLLSIGWWDWKREEIEEAMPYMKDVNKFIEKYG